MKCGPHRGKRGIIISATGQALTVRIESDESAVLAKPRELTNYSLAARKAWVSMPRRRVGRPVGTSKTQRISVTLRLDLELWDRFKRLESLRLIEDRTAVINDWFRQNLTQLELRSVTNGMATNKREPEDG